MLLLGSVVNKNKIINRMFGSSFVTLTISLVTRSKTSNRRGFVAVSVTKLTNLHIWFLILFLFNKRHCEQTMFAWQSFFMTSNHEIASSPSSSQRRKPLFQKKLDRKNYFTQNNYQ